MDERIKFRTDHLIGPNDRVKGRVPSISALPGFTHVAEADLTAIIPDQDGAPGTISSSNRNGWNRAGLERTNTSSEGSTSRERMLR